MASKGETIFGVGTILGLAIAEALFAGGAIAAAAPGGQAIGATGLITFASVPSTIGHISYGNVAKFIVINKSVYTGTTTQAPFRFNITFKLVQFPNGASIYGDFQQVDFAAGQQKTITFTFNLNTTYVGRASATAYVLDPTTTNTIATAGWVAVSIT